MSPGGGFVIVTLPTFLRIGLVVGLLGGGGDRLLGNQVSGEAFRPSISRMISPHTTATATSTNIIPYILPATALALASPTMMYVPNDCVMRTAFRHTDTNVLIRPIATKPGDSVADPIKVANTPDNTAIQLPIRSSTVPMNLAAVPLLFIQNSL